MSFELITGPWLKTVFGQNNDLYWLYATFMLAWPGFRRFPIAQLDSTGSFIEYGQTWAEESGEVTGLHGVCKTLKTPNIELHPPLPSEQAQFIGAWTQGVESVPQGCWPMMTPMLPTVVSSWLEDLWMVDHS